MSKQTRRQQIEEMLQADPKDAFLRYALAMEYASAGDDAGAVREFERITHDMPDYVPAYFQCAQVLVRLGRQADARAWLPLGIEAARRAGELHTAEEMQALLMSLG